MTDLDQRIAVVQRQIIKDFWAVDHGVLIEEPQITDDFRMTVGDTTLTAEQYRAFLRARPEAPYVTRHLVANLHLVTHDSDTITVAFSASVFRQEGDGASTSVVVSDFTDVWVDAGDTVLQRSRSITPVLMTASGGD